MDFMAQVRARITEHAFNPICIEAKTRKTRKKKTKHEYYLEHKRDPDVIQAKKEAKKRYLAKPEVRARYYERNKLWRAKQSPEWHQKQEERFKILRELHPKKKEPNNE